MRKTLLELQGTRWVWLELQCYPCGGRRSSVVYFPAAAASVSAAAASAAQEKTIVTNIPVTDRKRELGGGDTGTARSLAAAAIASANLLDHVLPVLVS
jgi:hypothetical protein